METTEQKKKHCWFTGLLLTILIIVALVQCNRVQDLRQRVEKLETSMTSTSQQVQQTMPDTSMSTEPSTSTNTNSSTNTMNQMNPENRMNPSPSKNEKSPSTNYQ